MNVSARETYLPNGPLDYLNVDAAAQRRA
jgi:hypothetical protein